MATEPKDGGPAFPVSSYVNVDGEIFDSPVQGMSYRRYLAARVPGWCSVYTFDDQARLEDVCRLAWRVADAMLATEHAQEPAEQPTTGPGSTISPEAGETTLKTESDDG